MAWTFYWFMCVQKKMSSKKGTVPTSAWLVMISLSIAGCSLSCVFNPAQMPRFQFWKIKQADANVRHRDSVYIATISGSLCGMFYHSWIYLSSAVAAVAHFRLLLCSSHKHKPENRNHVCEECVLVRQRCRSVGPAGWERREADVMKVGRSG